MVETAAGGDLGPLLHALDHRRSARRVAAFLADSGSERLPLVLSMLRGGRSADRERATEALCEAIRGGVRADAYIDQLAALDSDVRLMAVEIVGRLRTPTAVQALLEVLEHDPLEEMRSRAASALAEESDDTVKAALRRAQQHDPDRIVRSAAGRAHEPTRGASEPPTDLPTTEEEQADLDGARTTG
jgi:HEAT repeat protein